MSQDASNSNDQVRRWRHDIRGCLNNLVLTMEVLDHDLPNDEAVEFLEGLERSADKMAMLMDQFPITENTSEDSASDAGPAES